MSAMSLNIERSGFGSFRAQPARCACACALERSRWFETTDKQAAATSIPVSSSACASASASASPSDAAANTNPSNGNSTGIWSGVFPVDPCSFANVNEIRAVHFHLDLSVDFGSQSVSGFVDYDIERLVPSANTFILDSSDINISYVRHVQRNELLQFQKAAAHPVFGQAIHIQLPTFSTTAPASTLTTANQSDKDAAPAAAANANANANASGGGSGSDSASASGRPVGVLERIRVGFSTSASSSAIQWLPPSQTAGKQHPYLFTQCQAIHARAFFPCPDTPANKLTYTAQISVPAPLVAVMSAIPTSHSQSEDGKWRSFTFHQPIPIPTYLTAMAVGALEKRRIGPRSHVWSEKEMVDAAAAEFADTESFLSVAEELCGPYVWGQYDLLLLPPSFPYGGMENPNLTFVTPTLLAGDKSLANVVAHEIAHSWTGNSVTSATWEHFFLNEGFTVFIERKIAKRVHGHASAALDAISGLKALHDSVERYGAHHPFTALHVKLDGVDPDDAFSAIPYEKGFNLLAYLERIVGGEEKFLPFLKAYCQHFMLSTVTAHQFQQFFTKFFQDDQHAAQNIAKVDWTSWLDSAGHLPVPPQFDESLKQQALHTAEQLINTAGKVGGDVSNWRTNQLITLLEALQEQQTGGKLNPAAWKDLLMSWDERARLSHTKNSEVLHRLLLLFINSQVFDTPFSEADVVAGHTANSSPDAHLWNALVAFISGQGRMKFVRPLYRQLFLHGSPQGTAGFSAKLAHSLFQQYSTRYHAIAQKMIAKDLMLTK